MALFVAGVVCVAMMPAVGIMFCVHSHRDRARAVSVPNRPILGA